MEIIPIKTRTLVPPRDDFFNTLISTVETLTEGCIVALSSKAVAIGEGRCVPTPPGTDIRALKEKLAEQEADFFVRRKPDEHRHFTIIHGSLMGSAGIDESNGNNHLILWPKDPVVAAEWYRTKLMEHYHLTSLGVIITDSHSIPLHNGAIGIAIGSAGFLPIKDYRASLDLFSRPYKVERLNVADSLAVAASYTMGEGNESTPCVIFKDAPHVTFTDCAPSDPYLALTIRRAEDYFNRFLDSAEWERGGGGYDR